MWLWLLLAGVLGAGQGPRVYLSDGRAQLTVLQAVRGAQKRLDQPGCQRLFTDFLDQQGHPLVETLQATKASPADYLGSYLQFVDDDDAPQCRKSEVLAFTAPGYRVVRVCSSRFVAHFARQSSDTEIVIIHEMLHTLGLGENPPSPSAITGQVVKRCGR